MKSVAAISTLALAAGGCAQQPPVPVIAIGRPAPAIVSAAPAVIPLRAEQPLPVAAPGPLAAPDPALPPQLDAVRDLRPFSRRPRSIALLVTELQSLERLLAAAPAGGPDRPRIVQRLAEGYAEHRIAAQQPGVRIVQAARTAQAAGAAAIHQYDVLAHQYPSWCASLGPGAPAQSAGCADDALYYLGLERERAGDPMGARRAYFELISTYPQSRLVPGAYLAFGEMFLAESDQDPSKLRLAEQSYLEVSKYPPRDNWVFGYAQHQLGQVRLKRGDRAGAVNAFNAALAWARADPSAPGAGDLAAAAREELAALHVP